MSPQLRAELPNSPEDELLHRRLRPSHHARDRAQAEVFPEPEYHRGPLRRGQTLDQLPDLARLVAAKDPDMAARYGL